MFSILHIFCFTLPGQLLSCSEDSGWNYEKVGRSLREWLDNETLNLGAGTGSLISGNGIPSGFVWKMRGESKLDGFLYGKADLLGELSGDDIVFVFPDFETGLVGQFAKGELVVGRVCNIVGERCSEGVKQIEVKNIENDETVWEPSVSNLNRKHFEKYSKVMDPFEKKSVYVDKSTILSAGEGLFARREMARGDLISYFSGIQTFLTAMVFSNMSLVEVEEALAFSYSIGREVPEHWAYPKVS